MKLSTLACVVLVGCSPGVGSYATGVGGSPVDGTTGASLGGAGGSGIASTSDTTSSVGAGAGGLGSTSSSGGAGNGGSATSGSGGAQDCAPLEKAKMCGLSLGDFDCGNSCLVDRMSDPSVNCQNFLDAWLWYIEACKDGGSGQCANEKLLGIECRLADTCCGGEWSNAPFTEPSKALFCKTGWQVCAPGINPCAGSPYTKLADPCLWAVGPTMWCCE